MNVLFLASRYPWPLDDGGRQRMFHLARAIAGRHRVTLVTPPRGPGGGACPLVGLCERVVEVGPEGGGEDGGAGTPGRFGLWAPVRDRVRALVSSPLPSRTRSLW